MVVVAAPLIRGAGAHQVDLDAATDRWGPACMGRQCQKGPVSGTNVVEDHTRMWIDGADNITNPPPAACRSCRLMWRRWA